MNQRRLRRRAGAKGVMDKRYPGLVWAGITLGACGLVAVLVAYVVTGVWP